MARPTKEESAAKAALKDAGLGVSTKEETEATLNVPLVGMWFNTAEQRFETILAKCDPVTGAIKLEATKNSGVLADQSFSHLKKLILEQNINKGRF